MYPSKIENLKLIIQLSYLIPAALFQAKVIYVVAWKNREKFRKQSFFVIFLADCVTGFLLVLSSIFFSRPIMFLPQFCPFLSRFLSSHLYLLDVFYPIFRYLQALQILLQMLLITNRASCVLIPMTYSIFWRKWLKWVLVTVAILPFLWIWNVVISRKVIRHVYGGIFISYDRWVDWARTSLFFTILRGISIVVILISTVFTFFKVSNMGKTIADSERKLCFASIFMSICFTVPALTEFRYFQIRAELTGSNVIYALISISWDIQNVSSTFVLLFASAQFRNFVLNKKPIPKKKSLWSSISKSQVIRVTSLSH